MGDVVIPIAFPDYQIAVWVPAADVDFQVPGTSTRIKYHRKAQYEHVSHLGHAGVLYFNQNGSTRYYEYGRYDKAALGIVRKLRINDLKMQDGVPTHDSLKTVMRQISDSAGHKTRIEAAWIALPTGRFAQMEAYCQRRMKLNNDPKRDPYALLTNSCMHFALWTAEAWGADMPWIWDPRPINLAEECQKTFPPVRYRNGKLTVEGVDGL